MALPWLSPVFAWTVWKRMVVVAERSRRTHEREKGLGRAPTPQSGAGTQVLQERAGMAPKDPSLGVLHPTDHREQKRPVKGVTEGETQGDRETVVWTRVRARPPLARSLEQSRCTGLPA